uniref:SET domain-containing protein n=1 Tax=Aplanochytrium stocchinoi TaxID=215587 RepID=A0A7S3PI41_9STRA
MWKKNPLRHVEEKKEHITDSLLASPSSGIFRVRPIRTKFSPDRLKVGTSSNMNNIDTMLSMRTREQNRIFTELNEKNIHFKLCKICRLKICTNCSQHTTLRLWNESTNDCMKCKIKEKKQHQLVCATEYCKKYTSSLSRLRRKKHERRFDVIVEFEKGERIRGDNDTAESQALESKGLANKRRKLAFSGVRLISPDVSNNGENIPLPLYEQTYIAEAKKLYPGELITDYDKNYCNFQYDAVKSQYTENFLVEFDVKIDDIPLEFKSGLNHNVSVVITGRNGTYIVQNDNFIPKGEYMCEYIGVFKRQKQEEEVSESEGRLFQNKTMKISTHWCIDASKHGNLSHFLSFSPKKDLATLEWRLVSSSSKPQFPRVCLYAIRDIDPCSKLTIFKEQ